MKVWEFRFDGRRDAVLSYDDNGIVVLELTQVGVGRRNLILTMKDKSQLESDATNPIKFVNGDVNAVICKMVRDDDGNSCNVIMANTSIIGRSDNVVIIHVEDEDDEVCTHHLMFDSMVSVEISADTNEQAV